MTVGHLSRAEVIRGVDSRSNSGTWKHSSFIQASHLGLQSNQQSMQALPHAGAIASQHSPDSSRDTSPYSRQPSGPVLLPDWQMSSNPSFTDESPCAPVVTVPLHHKLLDPSVLDSVPSFGYERGYKALWLDRHSSLSTSSMISSLRSGDAESPLNDDVEAPRSDCLAYGPTWAISQSLVWRLAEEYVQGHPAPQRPRPSESQQYDAADGSCLDSATTTPAPTRTPPRGVLARSLSLPWGIGPVGLTPPARNRLKRAALTVIARGRLELRRGWQEAHLEVHGDVHGDIHTSVEAARVEAHKPAFPDAPATPPGNDAAAGGPMSVTPGAALPLASVASAPAASVIAAPKLAKCSQGRSREADVGHMLAEAAAEVMASCPASRQAVRRRVRALVAGVSVAYTAANLGSCAAALMHADFNNDFANSAKAVLDFVVTAPSVSGIVTDLLQIGVAVGIGMAQRRTPDF